MTNKLSAKELILQRGLRPKKSFGQNFMLDQQVNRSFSQAVADFGAALKVIEIGAGTGSLTTHLLSFAKEVHAVERDRDLVPVLHEQFKEFIESQQLIIHEADGARFPIEQLASPKSPAVLVGNLPYHLTSSIIFLAINHAQSLQGAVFLVQKEVADRLAALPNTKQYGFLTVVLKLIFSIDKVCLVNRAAFWPVPKVDSAIIRFRKIKDAPVIDSQEKFIVFVREVFQQRRKKLSTILRHQVSAEQFAKANIDPNLRPENLSPEQFLGLFVVKNQD